MTKASEPTKTRRKPAKRTPEKPSKAKAPAGKARSKRKAAAKAKSTARRPPLKVYDAVQRDLDQLAKRDPAIRDSARAATALALGRALDNPKASPTSKSMCARALNDTLDRMLELVPPVEDPDGVDKLAASRAARLAAKSKG